MSKSLEILLKNVTELMSLKGFRQTDLAKALGMSKQAVNQFLTGKHAPRLGTLDEIADGLGVPAFYLLMTPEERKTWDSTQKSGPSNLEQISELSALSNEELLKALNTLNERLTKVESGLGKTPLSVSGRQTENFKK
jgi:transcriptional regulator with XRE-family HTH domain